MRSRNGCLALAALALLLLVSGCGRFGRVNQGRVIEFDRAKGLVTLIQDSNTQPGKPRFDVLPPVTVRVPRDAREMGPEPEAGKLIDLDSDRGRAVVFDAQSGSLRTIAVSVVERRDNVPPSDARVAGLAFPMIDRAQRTVTVYSSARQQFIRFSVAGEHLSLPPDSWKMGDDVRYYYKEPGQALRLMNATKTDLVKGGK